MNLLRVLAQQSAWPLCLFICKMESVTPMSTAPCRCKEENSKLSPSIGKYQISLKPQG